MHTIRRRRHSNSGAGWHKQVIGTAKQKGFHIAAWYPRCHVEFHVQRGPLMQTTAALTGTLLGHQVAGRGRQAKETVISPGSFPSRSISTNSIMHIPSGSSCEAYGFHCHRLSSLLSLRFLVLQIRELKGEKVSEKEDLERESGLHLEKEHGATTVKALYM